MGTPGQVQVQVGAVGCCDEHQRGSLHWPQCAQLGLPAQEPESAYGRLPEG